VPEEAGDAHPWWAASPPGLAARRRGEASTSPRGRHHADGRPPRAGRDELAFGVRIQRACRLVEQTQPDLVTHNKLQVAVVGVVVALGDLLCLE
jgi:hypothetical protein